MKSDQDLYRKLRDLPKEDLWGIEVPRFMAASPRERLERVAVIRAVGTIFSRYGTEAEKDAVRAWLVGLLNDPQEKIRRYAVAALPKVGAGEEGEARMLALFRESGAAREKHHLGRALEKVGGVATLAVAESVQLPGVTAQKVRAAVLRKEQPGTVRLGAPLRGSAGLQVNLRCRRGLEEIVSSEAEEKLLPQGFRRVSVRPGCVTLTPPPTFSFGMLYGMRCFATVGFPLGVIGSSSDPAWVEELARCIASSRTSSLMTAATEGAARYRVDFQGRGHQRGAVRRVIERAYALRSEILNDARQAPWSVDVITVGRKQEGTLVELRPRLYPDPRLGYRQDDIAAASHPPLAACMARLAAETATGDAERVWDPFCGSGLELIERSLLGGVAEVHGTDLDAAALEVARTNFAAAGLDGVRSAFTCCDFRKAPVAPGSIDLIVTNPPLGRRVRVKDMQGLFADLLRFSVRALRPGGRLIYANPLRNGPVSPALRRESCRTVDLGGFDCQLEVHRKL